MGTRLGARLGTRLGARLGLGNWAWQELDTGGELRAGAEALTHFYVINDKVLRR